MKRDRRVRAVLRAGPEAGSGDRRISAGLQVLETTKAVEADARAAAEIVSQRKTIAIQPDNRASRAGNRGRLWPLRPESAKRNGSARKKVSLRKPSAHNANSKRLRTRKRGSAARGLTQLRRTNLRRKNRQVQVNWSQDEYMDDHSHAQEERRKLASLAIEAIRKSLGTKRSKNCCG